MAQTLIKNLIRQLRQLHEGSLWFEQYFNDKIGNLSDEQAFSKPIEQVHSVAEHVSHMLEWRKEAARRLNGGEPI